MFLLQKASRLNDDADMAWEAGDEAEGERLDKEVSQLWAENERRLEAAKARLEAFSEDLQASGWNNAGDTYPQLNGRHDTLQYCELWECAAESAQCLADG